MLRSKPIGLVVVDSKNPSLSLYNPIVTTFNKVDAEDCDRRRSSYQRWFRRGTCRLQTKRETGMANLFVTQIRKWFEKTTLTLLPKETLILLQRLCRLPPGAKSLENNTFTPEREPFNQRARWCSPSSGGHKSSTCEA